MDINRAASKSPKRVLIEDMPAHRATGNRKGRLVNIGDSNEYISLKPSYPTFITGQPHSGKTEFALEVVLNDIALNNATWFILSTEAGSTVELYSQLAEKYQGRGGRVFKNSKYAMSDDDLRDAMNHFQNHIRTIDPDDEWNDVMGGSDLNLENLFYVIDREEKILGKKFDGILIDPFNDLELNENKRIADQVKDEVKGLIRYGKKNNKTIILTIHANDTKPILMGSGDNKWYFYPPARPQELQGGQQFFRKGYQIISVFRPPQNWLSLQSDNPDMVEKHYHRLSHGLENENMTTIIIQKSKPKGIGKVGEFYIFYDKIRQRYYDVNEIGERIYSNGDVLGKTVKNIKTSMKPNEDFIKQTDEAPF